MAIDIEPWRNEPDRIDITRKGFDLAIRRNPELGNLCGYIRIPDWHPLYGEVSVVRVFGPDCGLI